MKLYTKRFHQLLYVIFFNFLIKNQIRQQRPMNAANNTVAMNTIQQMNAANQSAFMPRQTLQAQVGPMLVDI